MTSTAASSESPPGHEDVDLEGSRSSRKTSCAECHRLKLKCNKKFPCGSCSMLCLVRQHPLGNLCSSSRLRNSVMNDFPKLTTVITEMGERIRQLERAVADTHGQSSSSHPLLSSAPRPPRISTPAQNAEVLGAFSVNQAGDAVYFGPTAGTEIEGSSSLQSPVREQLSFTTVTQSFKFLSDQTLNWDTEQSLEQLFAHLPVEAQAWHLCETYYNNGCWTGMPVSQDEMVEILTRVYEPFRVGEQEGQPHHSMSTQKMAVLYFVFALGALVDLSLPPYSSEADHYFDLGCAAMSVKSLFNDPSVVTVQALSLLAMYFAHGGRRFTMDGAWSMISLASNIMQTALFWETYSIETIYGLSVGRPTGTFLSNISCPFPPDEEPETQTFVKLQPGYRHARWGYTTKVTAPIMETFLTTAKPSYETVLDLDQKIRKYMLSSPFEEFPTGIPRDDAMRDNPVNPLASQYSASYLAGIEIIVGTVATRYPSSKMAPHAILELFTAVDLIEKGAVSSGRARSGLAILQRLRDKAIAVYSQYSGHNLTPPPTADRDTEEELEIFAGYTRVVANKVLARGIRKRTIYVRITGYVQRFIPSSDLLPDFDPSIVEYFTLPAPASTNTFGNADWTSLLQYGTNPSEDAGFFFTFPPNSYASGSNAGPDPHTPSLTQEMQWAELLRTL
ncbi:hypothetical protein B0H10DRAFT_2076061 [Mycena sp. CBHHK59/15]|nr:hypothetical protein B0H10DRAFT_2076061 [Mycena sp. CBHHK59/15]